MTCVHLWLNVLNVLQNMPILKMEHVNFAIIILASSMMAKDVLNAKFKIANHVFQITSAFNVSLHII